MELVSGRVSHVRVPRGLVLPRCDDDELSGPDDALHHQGAEVSGRSAARVAIGLQQRSRFVPGGGPRLHVGDDVERAHIGGNGGGGGGGGGGGRGGGRRGRAGQAAARVRAGRTN